MQHSTAAHGCVPFQLFFSLSRRVLEIILSFFFHGCMELRRVKPWSGAPEIRSHLRLLLHGGTGAAREATWRIPQSKPVLFLWRNRSPFPTATRWLRYAPCTYAWAGYWGQYVVVCSRRHYLLHLTSKPCWSVVPFPSHGTSHPMVLQVRVNSSIMRRAPYWRAEFSTLWTG